jgi:hypothetical protein
MSSCDLSISLDQSDRSYTPGDRVSGTVRVEVSQEVPKQELRVTLGWRTHGRGNVANEEVARSVMHAGSLLPGAQHTYPFEFSLPKEGPYTYHGQDLNVDWQLEARSDIPWARDPVAREDILVTPGDVSPRATQSSQSGDRAGSQQSDPQRARQLALVIGLVAFAGGIAGVLLKGSPFPGIASVFGLLIAAGPIRHLIASRRTGDVRLQLDELTRDDQIQCSVHLAPTASAQINHVRARLVVQEVVTRGSGTNRHTYRHQVHEQGADMLAAGRSVHGYAYSVRLPIPQPVPWSFSASDNDLKWMVEVHIDVAGWPDWKSHFPIWMAPGDN